MSLNLKQLRIATDGVLIAYLNLQIALIKAGRHNEADKVQYESEALEGCIKSLHNFYATGDLDFHARYYLGVDLCNTCGGKK